MTDKKLCRELADIPLEDLEQLLQLLADVEVSPTDLLSYAIAVGVANERTEHAEDFDVLPSAEELLEMSLRAEEDDGDLVDIIYYNAKTCLAKMGQL